MKLKKLLLEENLTPNSKVKDAYCKEYSSDELGKDLDPKITFKQIYDGMKKGKNFYDMIDVGDSLIRERIFGMMSKIFNVDYDEIYYTWLGKR